jgi:hypothetical protein
MSCARAGGADVARLRDDCKVASIANGSNGTYHSIATIGEVISRHGIHTPGNRDPGSHITADQMTLPPRIERGNYIIRPCVWE